MSTVSSRAFGAARTTAKARVVPRFAANVLALALALAGGCSLSVDSERAQCATNEDCAQFVSNAGYSCIESFCVEDQVAAPMCTVDSDCDALGGDFVGNRCVTSMCQPDPIWGCVGKPLPPAASPGPFQVRMSLTNIVDTEAPMVGVTANLCNKLDLECDAPIGTPVVSDENGQLTLEVRAGFNGYVYLTREEPLIMPTLYFFAPTVDRDQEIASVQIATPDIAAALAGVALPPGSPIMHDPARGLVLLAVLGCAGKEQAGVTLSSDQADATTAVFYATTGLPDSAATATDISGYGGFINTRPGVFPITATLAENARPLGSMSVLSKAGAMTITRFSPLGL